MNDPETQRIPIEIFRQRQAFKEGVRVAFSGDPSGVQMEIPEFARGYAYGQCSRAYLHALANNLYPSPLSFTSPPSPPKEAEPQQDQQPPPNPCPLSGAGPKNES